MDTRQILGLGIAAVAGYFLIPRIVGAISGAESQSAETVSPAASVPGTFSPEGAFEVANAYLEVPLANDRLMEEYSMQGRGLGNYANHSLLGDKYVAAMSANGMLAPYQSIYGGA